VFDYRKLVVHKKFVFTIETYIKYSENDWKTVDVLLDYPRISIHCSLFILAGCFYRFLRQLTYFGVIRNIVFDLILL